MQRFFWHCYTIKHYCILLHNYLLTSENVFNLYFQVESENKYERVGGTSMGGGTFWGLGSLLTSAKVQETHLTTAKHKTESGAELN